MSVRQVGKDPASGDGFWFVDLTWRDPLGEKWRKQARVRGVTRQEAVIKEGILVKELEDEWKKRLDRLRRGEPDRQEGGQEVRFKAFTQEYLRWVGVHSRTEGTKIYKRRIIKHLVDYFGDIQLSRIKEPQVTEFIATMRKTISNRGKPLGERTIRNRCRVLSNMLRLAKRRGYILTVPDLDIPTGHTSATEADFLTEDEYPQLIAGALPGWGLRIEFIILTGLRVGEFQALRWDDVHLNQGDEWIHICRSISEGIEGLPKRGRTRDVHLCDRAADILRSLPRHIKSSRVFQEADGGDLNYWKARAALTKSCHQATIRKIGWHGLRHTYGCKSVVEGKSLIFIQRQMGHQSLETTQQYLHLSRKFRAKQAKKTGNGAR